MYGAHPNEDQGPPRGSFLRRHPARGTEDGKVREPQRVGGQATPGRHSAVHGPQQWRSTGGVDVYAGARLEKQRDPREIRAGARAGWVHPSNSPGWPQPMRAVRNHMAAHRRVPGPTQPDQQAGSEHHSRRGRTRNMAGRKLIFLPRMRVNLPRMRVSHASDEHSTFLITPYEGQSRKNPNPHYPVFVHLLVYQGGTGFQIQGIPGSKGRKGPSTINLRTIMPTAAPSAPRRIPHCSILLPARFRNAFA